MPPFLGNELLRGKRVELRLPTQADIEAFALWTHDVEYQRLLRRSMIYPANADMLRSYLEHIWKEERDYPFSIVDRNDGRLLGVVVITHVQWQARHCSFWIGIGSASERGKGYGSDAVRVLLQYAFLEMNLNCVRLEVMAYNTDALRAYERAGFRADGRQRAAVYRDSVYYDIVLMSILRVEWEALTSQPAVRYQPASASHTAPAAAPQPPAPDG
jgi:RimJ/RimL family protein N-acetyltransferase